jgi:hypothetical protein
MGLFLIDIHWQRRAHEDGRERKGIAQYAENGRTFTAAKNKAIRKFNRHLGLHLRIDKTEEHQDPAQIFVSDYDRVDCGSNHPYGICPACGCGHGTVLVRNGVHPTLA